jgi:hypothetical protein
MFIPAGALQRKKVDLPPFTFSLVWGFHCHLKNRDGRDDGGKSISPHVNSMPKMLKI